MSCGAARWVFAMKFGKQLRKLQVIEWREFYVDYALLKRTLREVVAVEAGALEDFEEVSAEDRRGMQAK